MSKCVCDCALGELARSLSPAAVSQYLAGTGRWELERRDEEIKEIWSLPDGHGGLRARVMLPLATDYVDFDRRFVDTLRDLAGVNGWSAAELGQHLAPASQAPARRPAELGYDDLRAMSPQERLRLRQALAELDAPPDPPERRLSDRGRIFVLAAVIVCCVVLAAWIGLLADTLPRFYRTGGWRGAWVGFDLVLLATFVVTGWAAWRRRQVLIICLVVLATLLCCDAWFDVLLDARTSGFWLSLASALIVELPLAAVAIAGARRLLRMTSAVSQRHRGEPGPVPRLRDLPLAGLGPERPLRDVLTGPDEHVQAAPAEREL